MSIPRDVFLDYKPVRGETIRYPQLKDAQMRLSEGVAFFNGVPVWLSRVDENGEGHWVIMANTLDDKQKCYIDVEDIRLDIATPEIGWVNTEGYGPIHMARRPARQQHQTLEPNQCHLTRPFDEDIPQARVVFSWKPSSSFTPMNLYAMLVDDYPIIDAVVGAKERFPLGGAISKNYCIACRKGRDSLYLLKHHQFNVGYYRPKSRTFVFVDESLTKTRRRELEDIISANGGGYAIEEYAIRS